MRFNPKARLDTGRTRDRGRGRASRSGGPLGGALGGGGGGGGGGSALPGGLVGGGGIGAVVLVVLVLVLTQCVGGGGSDPGGAGSSAYDTSRMDAGTDRYAGCETGEDANASADCARVAVENSLTDFWAEELGSRFRAEQALVTFTGSVATDGCGEATSAVGPFYCPPDETIYLDTAFFDQVLEDQLGGPDGGFVEPYVLAHEYGHHVQNLLGTMGRVRTQEGPRSDSVRLELQADCYAGMWAHAATTTEDSSGQVLVAELTDDDIRQALGAAAAVGDDRIQQQAQGTVDEESWTHGSSASRQRWFGVGYAGGTLEDCDTFATDDL
ncbi:KPN_02809 family neutral zinc metallopeptidase [Nocardioides kribbensis]|uniref:KPN_02809 family neutral zinc metallopeptidase n=1 Tax=Nocardioides kribbensis TaxID=305517 RepID=UPI0032D9FB76